MYKKPVFGTVPKLLQSASIILALASIAVFVPLLIIFADLRPLFISLLSIGVVGFVGLSALLPILFYVRYGCSFSEEGVTFLCGKKELFKIRWENAVVSLASIGILPGRRPIVTLPAIAIAEKDNTPPLHFYPRRSVRGKNRQICFGFTELGIEEVCHYYSGDILSDLTPETSFLSEKEIEKMKAALRKFRP